MQRWKTGREQEMLQFSWLPLDWAPQARLETPLGHPQSQHNRGCWAPGENSPSLEALLTEPSACSGTVRNLISRHRGSPPSPGGCSRGTWVCTHRGQLYLRLWG